MGHPFNATGGLQLIVNDVEVLDAYVGAVILYGDKHMNKVAEALAGPSPLKLIPATLNR